MNVARRLGERKAAPARLLLLASESMRLAEEYVRHVDNGCEQHKAKRGLNGGDTGAHNVGVFKIL